ncbi:MAG: DUF1653 domain-containing protein [Pseudomonadales bacterium]|nr:DUF1653 domain-containing protein [Pseudomonadales bacterium]
MANQSLPELPEPGIYRHYKGKFYEVLGTAVHSESGEQLVVYRACYGKRGLWVRPLAMFVESVEVNGSLQPRFAPEEEA